MRAIRIPRGMQLTLRDSPLVMLELISFMPCRHASARISASAALIWSTRAFASRTNSQLRKGERGVGSIDFGTQLHTTRVYVAHHVTVA